MSEKEKKNKCAHCGKPITEEGNVWCSDCGLIWLSR